MALARNEFVVVPTGTDWQIMRNGEHFLVVQTKDVAVDEAVFQAARNEPSHIVVKRLDGSTEDEAAFGDVPGAPGTSNGRRQPWPA